MLAWKFRMNVFATCGPAVVSLVELSVQVFRTFQADKIGGGRQTRYPHGDHFPPYVAVPICGVTDELARPQSQPYLVILIKEYMFPKHPQGPGL